MTPDKPDISVTIQNIVASVTTGETINLQDVVRAFPEAEYRPNIFPGLCFRLKKPKTATLIFNSGRMVCTGAKSVKEVEKAVHKVLRGLKQEGIITNGRPEIEVQNIVASAVLGGEIDLEKAAYSLGRTMYEPEQFPGAIYRMSEPKCVILIFAQGKLVITGAKKEEEPFQAAKGLRKTLEENELIYYG